jgi:hypothetical protein
MTGLATPAARGRPNARQEVRGLVGALLATTLAVETTTLTLVVNAFRVDGSAAHASASLLALIVASAAFAPVAGHLADRHDRRRVMLVSNLIAAACCLTIAVVDRTDVAIAFAFGIGLSVAPIHAALSAEIGRVMVPEQLVWANALRTRAASLGTTLGPFAAGLAIAAAGAAGALAIATAELLLAALLTWRCSSSVAEQVDAAPLVPSAPGYGHPLRNRAFVVITGSWSMVLGVVGVTMVAEYPLVETLGGGSVLFGLAVAGWGLGSVAGSFVAARASVRRAYAMFAVAAFGAAAAIAAIGQARLPAAFVAANALGGFAEAHSSVALQTIFQLEIPDGYRGRAFAWYDAATLGALGLSLVAAPPIVDAVAPGDVFLAAGGAVLAVAVGASAALSWWVRPGAVSRRR